MKAFIVMVCPLTPIMSIHYEFVHEILYIDIIDKVYDVLGFIR